MDISIQKVQPDLKHGLTKVTVVFHDDSILPNQLATVEISVKGDLPISQICEAAINQACNFLSQILTLHYHGDFQKRF